MTEAPALRLIRQLEHRGIPPLQYARSGPWLNTTLDFAEYHGPNQGLQHRLWYLSSSYPS